MDNLIVDPWKTRILGDRFRQKGKLKSNQTRRYSQRSKITFHFGGSLFAVFRCIDGVSNVGQWSWAICFNVRAPVSTLNEFSFQLAFV